jgi:hypothetical protein
VGLSHNVPGQRDRVRAGVSIFGIFHLLGDQFFSRIAVSAESWCSGNAVRQKRKSDAADQRADDRTARAKPEIPYSEAAMLS